MSAHQLHGGPLEGTVVMTGKYDNHFPAELRLLRDGEDGVIEVHVYGLNKGHTADVARPVRPTYHYTHTTSI